MRRDDWAERLEVYLRQAGARPFAWGAHDCALFAAGAADAQTDGDFAGAYRGRYDSELGAMKTLALVTGVAAGAGLEALLIAAGDRSGRPRRASVLHAQRGDVVLAYVPRGGADPLPALGVVDLSGRFAVFIRPGGLLRLPVAECRIAWEPG